MKKEVIISVYNRDTLWTNQLNKDISIKKYRKGINLNLSDETYLPINVGRDVHTFFYHILNNYDNLSDITFFSQDYPFDHIENYVEIINSDVDFITKCSVLHFDGYWGFHWNSIGTMWQLNQSNQFANGRILTSANDGYPHDRNLYVDETWESLFNCPHPSNYDFVPGGHFCVTRETIKIRSKEFYQHIVTLLETYDKMPWSIERLEPYIFNKNYI